MEKLPHRERVRIAFAHQEPDRVPIDFMGNASMILDDTYFRLRDHLGIQGDIPPVREGATANYYDERILDRFDVDFRRLFLPVYPGFFTYYPDGTFSDIWGMLWQKSGIYVNCMRHPLGEASLDEVAAYVWPDPEQVWHANGLADHARHMYEQTDYALAARNPVTWGFLDLGCRMRGMQQFLMDLALNPEMARLIIDGALKMYLKIYDMFLEAVGPYVDMVETADDLGTQKSLLISPDTYREFFQPAEKQINALIKARAPQAKVFMHCDGSLVKIIPDLIDAGVEILNPVQPSAKGMESADLKLEYGDRLIFHGAVDQKPQEGTEEEIRAEVRRRIDALAPGGGYILSTSNTIVDPPLENIVALFDEAHTYGQYQRER